MGQRHNMNGAGRGGRLVANTDPTRKSLSTLGGRDRRQADLEEAFRNGSGMSDKNKALGRRNRREMRALQRAGWR